MTNEIVNNIEWQEFTNIPSMTWSEAANYIANLDGNWVLPCDEDVDDWCKHNEAEGWFWTLHTKEGGIAGVRNLKTGMFSVADITFKMKVIAVRDVRPSSWLAELADNACKAIVEEHHSTGQLYIEDYVSFDPKDSDTISLEGDFSTNEITQLLEHMKKFK